MFLTIEQIEKMTPRELQSALQQLCFKVNEADEKALIASISLKELKSYKDIKFAEIVRRQKGASIRQNELYAKIDPEWIQFLRTICQAEVEFEKAEADKKKQNRLWETTRSILSSRTAEMRNGL